MKSNNDKKILIVEDEKAIRLALHDFLNEEGFVLLEAKNGEEGLEMTLREHPDLILIDIQLPKIDGLLMLKKIREHEQFKNTKFIIITNGDTVNGADNARKIAGVPADEQFEYFIKVHLDIQELVKKIRSMLAPGKY